MNTEEFVNILKERVHVGDAFENAERQGTFFTVDSISNSKIMFKLGGQVIKLSVSDCVDVLNEFSGYSRADGDLSEYIPNKFSVRYHYKNCICLLWLFTEMGLTIESEVQLGIYESGVPMFYVNLK